MRWQVTSFQVIAGSSVVFMCHTIKILIANWPRTRKFSQLFTGREDCCFWLLTLYVQFLCSDWSKFNRWCSILNLVYFDIWSWQSFVSTFDVLTVFFHWMYKMNFSCYQESSVIHGSLFIGFLVEKYVACQSRKSNLRWRRFRFHLALMRKRVAKSEAIQALLDTFQELHLEW